MVLLTEEWDIIFYLHMNFFEITVLALPGLALDVHCTETMEF